MEVTNSMVDADRAAAPVAVFLEVGMKKVFACALDWPGWCRSGKDEAQALVAVSHAASRYAAVAREAGIPFPFAPGDSFEVVERRPGSPTTDFGAPGEVAAHDAEPLTTDGAERLAALVEASWRVLDRVVANAPAELRKGPRGGGRARDEVVRHVLAAEAMYARKIGIRHRDPAPGDGVAIAALHRAIADALTTAGNGESLAENSWLPRYAARRIAWHVLDHAWEIEDRSDS